MPSWSMGKAKRGEKDDRKSIKIPGPGEYNTNNEGKARRNSPCWSMGCSKRGIINSSFNNPGPGSYEPKRNV